MYINLFTGHIFIPKFKSQKYKWLKTRPGKGGLYQGMVDACGTTFTWGKGRQVQCNSAPTTECWDSSTSTDFHNSFALFLKLDLTVWYYSLMLDTAGPQIMSFCSVLFYYSIDEKIKTGSRSEPLLVWSLHVLPMSAWVFSSLRFSPTLGELVCLNLSQSHWVWVWVALRWKGILSRVCSA